MVLCVTSRAKYVRMTDGVKPRLIYLEETDTDFIEMAMDGRVVVEIDHVIRHKVNMPDLGNDMKRTPRRTSCVCSDLRT